MTTEDKIKIMQAYLDGKKIEVCIDPGEWQEVDEPEWNWFNKEYRIKPDADYRPYKDYHEMIDDFCERFNVHLPDHAMPLIWMKSKQRDFVSLVDTFNENADMNDYFIDETYLDGSPVGKKVEK